VLSTPENTSAPIVPLVGSCTVATVGALVGGVAELGITPLLVFVFWKLGHAANATVALIESARAKLRTTVKNRLFMNLFMRPPFFNTENKNPAAYGSGGPALSFKFLSRRRSFEPPRVPRANKKRAQSLDGLSALT
jgi:hypothetical protein